MLDRFRPAKWTLLHGGQGRGGLLSPPLAAASDGVRFSEPIGRAPIIVTALMGAEDFAWADKLRKAHFPADRNFVPAHISLFHHLPPSGLDDLLALLRSECANPQPRARIASVMSLGRGVAYRIESDELLASRQRIADAFAGQLIPQDQRMPRLHLTVQNKVDQATAKALHVALAAEFWPRPLTIIGLAAWHYLGGPWKLAGQAKFRGVRRV